MEKKISPIRFIIGLFLTIAMGLYVAFWFLSMHFHSYPLWLMFVVGFSLLPVSVGYIALMSLCGLEWEDF